MSRYIASGSANSSRRVIPRWNIQYTIHLPVPLSFLRAVEYIKDEYQFDSPRFNLKTLPINFQVGTPQTSTSSSTTQNSPYSFPDSLDESASPPPSPLPPPQNEWSDPDAPHSWIDISSFDTPESLQEHIIQVESYYASIFPSCRHLQFFQSEKEAMFHIVEAHIEPTEKRYVCINCAAEFDGLKEADQHAFSKQNIISPDVLSPQLQY